MLDKIFGTIIDETEGITVSDFFLMLAVAVGIGVIFSLLCAIKNNFSKGYKITVALLPSVVAVVIVMVNGSLGVGIAVAGAFSLVRFRSSQGTAKEICALFIAMATGLTLGMGYLTYAVLFALISGLLFVLFTTTRLFEKKDDKRERIMKITIPEDLNYEGVFDELFKAFTLESKLIGVKTTNMGSMFKLTYKLTMRAGANEKTFLDKLRERNGNLEIVLNGSEFQESEL